jgi:hypothetical protein
MYKVQEAYDETIFISFKEIQFDQLLPTAWR